MISAGQRTLPVFHRNGNNSVEALKALQSVVLEAIKEDLGQAFPRYDSKKDEFIDSYKAVLSVENLAGALSPSKLITTENAQAVADQIFHNQLKERDLQDRGAFANYTKVEFDEGVLKKDDGSNYTKPIEVVGGIAVYPLKKSDAEKVTDNPQDMKNLIPRTPDSTRCAISTKDDAFYLLFGAFGVTSGMVLQSQKTKNGSVFHLAPKEAVCKANGKEYKTHDVQWMDGIKTLVPIMVEQNGVEQEMTLAFNSSVSVWTGTAGWARGWGSPEDNRQTYSNSLASDVTIICGAKR